MNKKYWIGIYLFVLAVHLAGNLLPNETIENITKPFLMPILMFGFMAEVGKLMGTLKISLLAALFFSWAGDIFLMFQENDRMFFLLGLSAFLLAHVCYIIFFHRIRVAENIRSNPWLMLPVLIYYIVLISWLGPYLGDMRIPVRIYGIVISFMLMLAIHMLYIKNKTAGRYMMIGALLFILSDTANAIQLFYQPFIADSFIIMITYGLAQLLIVYGAINYIQPAGLDNNLLHTNATN